MESLLVSRTKSYYSILDTYSMDSFEAATQFTQILRGLTPSLQLLVKASHFALKNAESEDYLCSSIISILTDPKIELNTKSTIFQFIEVLLTESIHNVSLKPYMANLQSSLPKILLLVLPNTNNSNIYNVFLSLKSISKLFDVDTAEFVHKYNSNLLTADDLKNINSNLEFHDIQEPLDTVSELQSPVAITWTLLLEKKRQSQYERARLLKNSKIIDNSNEQLLEEGTIFNLKDKNDKSMDILTKKQILLRMEDDREAHKRSKENLWVTSRPKEATFATEDEFEKHYWENSPTLTKVEVDTLLESLDELNKFVDASYKDAQYIA